MKKTFYQLCKYKDETYLHEVKGTIRPLPLGDGMINIGFDNERTLWNATIVENGLNITTKYHETLKAAIAAVTTTLSFYPELREMEAFQNAKKEYDRLILNEVVDKFKYVEADTAEGEKNEKQRIYHTF